MPNLNGLPALETAIGLVFLYFLLSTVCSAINEGIANVLGWRAKTLEDAIRGLLGDRDVRRGWKEWLGRIDKRDAPAQPAAGAGVPTDLASAVFDHWRIATLVRNPDSSRRRRSRPSYLPPRAFSLAVAETLAMHAPPHPDSGKSPWEHGDEALLEHAKAALGALPDGQVRQLLQKAATNADDRLEGFRAQVETGFDDAMERASGWYKRKVQSSLVVIAAVIAIGLNVDSLSIGSRLWSDQPTRAAVAASASRQTGGPQSAADAAAQVRQLQLPIGWGAGNAPDGPWAVLRRVPGWLMTVAAMSLGAPFWFDLLSRVARLRGSGVPERPRSLSDSAGTIKGT